MYRQQFPRGGKSAAVQSIYRKSLLRGVRVGPVAALAVIVLAGLAGCSSRGVSKTPLAEVRLFRLLKFYQMYTTAKKKPPANEEEFKEYLRTLPQDEKAAAGIVGDDVDSLLVSPRDGQKYHIEYGVVARPTRKAQALAWEETGQGGKRFVLLTMGYVNEYNEEMFQQYKAKHKK
jgi:hypothetical protein